MIPIFERAIFAEATTALNAFFPSKTMKNLVYAKKTLIRIAKQKYKDIPLSTYGREDTPNKRTKNRVNVIIEISLNSAVILFASKIGRKYRNHCPTEYPVCPSVMNSFPS